MKKQSFLVHQSPDEAVVAKCRELESIRKKDGKAMYWGVVREVLKSDPWFLMRVALEWGWLDENLVGHKFIKHISDNWGEDLGVLFPRGHGKTLPMSAMVISSIINDPNIAILEVSRTDDNAQKIGNFISDQLLYNDYLQNCFGRAHHKDGFLPTSKSECKLWGTDGYTLPYRKARIDPTLLCISLRAAKAGKHPDIVWVDDPTEKENNHEDGWKDVKEVIQGLWFLLPAHGFMIWTGTRWHDADPLGAAVKGKLRGKKGTFNFIKESCYTADDPKLPPTYPYKTRWNMKTPSGYTPEMLLSQMKPESEGGLGYFFNAQMRNDPSPIDMADIKVEDINIYEPEQGPKHTEVKMMGIETTGGGLPIYNGFLEWLEGLSLSLPVLEIVNPKKAGTDKRDRIVAELQPLISSGRMYAQQWMIGDNTSTEGLGYELRRVGKAQHDDIADAIHNVPGHLSKGLRPSHETDPADLYISVDLAWSEKKRADWTVAAAVAVDHSGNHWVLDYDRFQVASPTGIYTRLLEFYNKFNNTKTIRQLSRRKYPGAWR